MHEKNASTYRQELRERILEVAMKAFATDGIKAVKMDYIAQSLGISKRTLYELYKNKELLLFEGIKKFKTQRQRESMLLASESANVMDLLIRVYRVKTEEFRQVNPLFFSDIVKYPSVLKYLEDDRQNTRTRLKAFLKRGVNEGYFRSDVDYDMVLRMLDSLNDFVMRAHLFREYSIEHLFKNIIFVSLRGLCTKRGIEVLDKFLDEDV